MDIYNYAVILLKYLHCYGVDFCIYYILLKFVSKLFNKS